MSARYTGADPHPEPRLSTLVSALALCLSSSSGDWPQYNGPAQDRTVPGAIVAGEDFPEVRWKIDVGSGFSSLTVSGGKAYSLVQRDLSGKATEILVSLDAATGKELWSAALSPADYDGGGNSGTDDNQGGDGPRTTPSVADGRVIALDAQLLLAAFDAGSGKELWRHDLVKEFGAKPIRWQNGASPLVDGGRVFVVGGGEGKALLAFDAKSGALAWAVGDEQMTHATPVAATILDQRQVIFFVQSGLVSVVPESGAVLWRTEFPYRTSTAASPVVADDVVYCSAGYGVGAAAWCVAKGADGWKPELLWRAPNKLINHWSTPVAHDGHLYGMFSFKEYGKGPLQCVELATGEVRWSQEGFGPGNCILVGDTLVALSDAGEVVLVEPKSDAYHEKARADVLDGKCWSMPAFSDGALYVRSTRQAARVDVGGDSTR